MPLLSDCFNSPINETTQSETPRKSPLKIGSFRISVYLWTVEKSGFALRDLGIISAVPSRIQVNILNNLPCGRPLQWVPPSNTKQHCVTQNPRRQPTSKPQAGLHPILCVSSVGSCLTNWRSESFNTRWRASVQRAHPQCSFTAPPR